MTRNYVARLNTDGSLDTGVDPNANGSVLGFALQADGKVLIGGRFTTVGGLPRNYLARLNADGSADTNFIPNGSNTYSGPALQADGLALQADGKVLIGGGYTSAGEATRGIVARLLNEPATQSLTIPDPSRLLWSRSGSAPEVEGVIFEQSLDNGATWSPLGPGLRVSGTANWEITGLSLETGVKVRATGRSVGGIHNGSGGLHQQVYPAVRFGEVTASSVLATEATLDATTTLEDLIASVTERGFVYSATETNNDPLIDGTGVSKMTAVGTTGPFTSSLTGLTPGTRYSYKAYVISSEGTSYTPEQTFDTRVCR